MSESIKLFWGAWRLDGVWMPNPLLKMSAEEQRRQNLANGYDCPSSPRSPQAHYRVVTA